MEGWVVGSWWVAGGMGGGQITGWVVGSWWDE